jgi:hypothetical protein
MEARKRQNFVWCKSRVNNALLDVIGDLMGAYAAAQDQTQSVMLIAGLSYQHAPASASNVDMDWIRVLTVRVMMRWPLCTLVPKKRPRRLTLSDVAAANDVYRLRLILRRISAAVATSREGHHPPR